MLKTLKLLQDDFQGDVIKSFDILDFKSSDRFYYLKIKAVLSDGSSLHIREFFSSDDALYSYHWQDEFGSLRIRWITCPIIQSSGRILTINTPPSWRNLGRCAWKRS